MVEELIELAKVAAKNAYAPYSQFPVGAAMEDTAGNRFSGCNVENVAFPSGLCAERTAICKAVSDTGPKLKIKTVVVYTPTPTITTPCGACRQVIQEFATEHTRVLCVCDGNEQLDVLFSQIMPQATVIDGLTKI